VLCVPPLQKGVAILREGKRYSSRFTYRPYPLAASLWLGHESSAPIPADMKAFLFGAIDYLAKEEWRTSIVLSAISVESGLADLYEECHREPAPDKPLGDLFYLVKSRIKFPSDVEKAIELANQSRIAAVHRSRLPVSQKEAISALFGAINFTRWHVFEFS
jgi:hypothetical protein